MIEQKKNRGEKALEVFLDKYFYKKIEGYRMFCYFNRFYDEYKRKKGTDVLLDNKKIVERVQNFGDRFISFFDFEVDYFDKKDKNLIDGWFVGDNDEVDDYLLIWIHEVRTPQVNRLVADDFEKVEVNFLNKNNLKVYLKKIGIADSVIKEKSKEMREQHIKSFELNNQCKLVYKESIIEDTINLVVEKTLLDELSNNRFMITKGEVTKL